MAELEAIVFIVDDDASVRTSTERLVRSQGFRVQTFGSAREFLAASRPEGPACLVLDVRLPGLSGLDLQHELTRSGLQIPIIMEKMNAASLAELVRMAGQLGISPGAPPAPAPKDS